MATPEKTNSSPKELLRSAPPFPDLVFGLFHSFPFSALVLISDFGLRISRLGVSCLSQVRERPGLVTAQSVSLNTQPRAPPSRHERLRAVKSAFNLSQQNGPDFCALPAPFSKTRIGTHCPPTTYDKKLHLRKPGLSSPHQQTLSHGQLAQ